jgi:hypothetical protein
MLFPEVITLTVAGLLVGNELAIAVFVHPVLSRLPDPVHFAAAKALASLLGRVMPFWYALVVVLTTGLALLIDRSTGAWPRPIVCSAGLWVVSIVFSITSLVPINNRVSSWSDDTKPTDWKTFRSRWDHLHRWRVLLLTTAFALLAIGLLQGNHAK